MCLAADSPLVCCKYSNSKVVFLLRSEHPQLINHLLNTEVIMQDFIGHDILLDICCISSVTPLPGHWCFVLFPPLAPPPPPGIGIAATSTLAEMNVARWEPQAGQAFRAHPGGCDGEPPYWGPSLWCEPNSDTF